MIQRREGGRAKAKREDSQWREVFIPRYGEGGQETGD